MFNLSDAVYTQAQSGTRAANPECVNPFAASPPPRGQGSQVAASEQEATGAARPCHCSAGPSPATILCLQDGVAVHPGAQHTPPSPVPKSEI